MRQKRLERRTGQSLLLQLDARLSRRLAESERLRLREEVGE
jgi:hypothetical protein